ncbi:H-NS histone family protein [Bradyrhizobium manausense]|uniref:H-NS histone family protein n=1 Tax=Bradyrhizobium manausense TaxID=989370 RepID=UPI001BA5228B|nr:H-NS histone family protein [Bradyrhizobium manausense]MBR1090305.1 H-NS histone family protein [Bradyrhizobium manausense]
MDCSPFELEGLSVDQLSDLYDQVRQTLAEKIKSEKHKLEQKLIVLNAGLTPVPRQPSKAAGTTKSRDRDYTAGNSGRRNYPAVQPKYQNPDNLSETWAGRGKQPKWLVAQLNNGKAIEEFLIK